MLSLAPYLDYRNQSLWDEVNTKFHITLEYNKKSSYGVYTINNDATIYVPHSEPCHASFSHELLHLWMNMKDVSVSSTLTYTFKTDSILKLLFKSELGEHLGNCADHYKMLPLYLEMGFNRDLFIADYNKPQGSELELSLIGRWYNNSDFPSKQYVTEQFLAQFFSIKSCPNPKFNYDALLASLKSIDNTLFDILDSFWNKLTEFDITKTRNSTSHSYRLFTYPFTEDLKLHLATRFST